MPLQGDTLGSAGRLLWILLGAVSLLLLIACVNVASLFLARGAAREPELAVRTALGCSRWGLTRHLLVESLLLSIAGGLAGLGLSRLVTQMYFPGEPLNGQDRILNAVPDAGARERLIARLVPPTGDPANALVYEHRIVLRGRRATPAQP